LIGGDVSEDLAASVFRILFAELKGVAFKNSIIITAISLHLTF
jgi:hypothetical protein